MKMLFVCGGNTCRSPMAAALAKAKWGDAVQTDSAGTVPHGKSAEPDAIAVIRDRIGVDLSRHRPRGIEAKRLGDYDYIVAMDAHVARTLREDYQLSDSRLIEWQICDPYLRGREGYERRADDIVQAIGDLRPMLVAAEQARPPIGVEKPLTDSTGMPSVGGLRRDIERWKAELLSGEIRGTLLQGIAKKAADSFEVVFRRSVESYCALARDEEAVLGKPFERFTFGEMINYVAKRNAHFTAACRRIPRGTELFRNRRLVSPQFRQLLDKTSSERNRLHHRPDAFAPDLDTLHDNSLQLLNLLSEALGDAYFAFLEAEPTS